MELSEYRKQKRENRTRAGAGLVGSLGALDATGPYALDAVQSAVIALPWHGGVTVAALGGGVIAGTIATRQRRTTDEWQRRQVLRAREWAGRRTRREHIGLTAARRSAKNSRPDLTSRQRMRAHPDQVGIQVGSTITGPRNARGKPIVLPWELGGALVLGEPGSRKSTLLAGIVTRLPGASVVVSTKTEFAVGTGSARRGSDGSRPVYAFNPLSWGELPEHVYPFQWSLVRGCADARIAQRRAQALMQATESAGLANSGFWEGKGRSLLSALLCAADLGGSGLRDLAEWLQHGDYSQPQQILDRNSDHVERSMINTLRQLRGSGDRTASSVSHTAAAVLEFLSDSRIADALDPDPRTTVDMADLIRRDGTLYLVTDNAPSLAPVISAIWDSLVDAAKTVAGEHSSRRLPRPLTLVADEIDKTLPSVPIDQHAAELRGWGVFILGATQNRDRLVAVWGRDSAAALLSSLQTHVVLSLNRQDDREEYQRRIGHRSVQYVKTSESGPAGHLKRMFGSVSREGHSSSTSIETQREPLWSAESWSQLEAGYALVIPTKGSPAIVDTGHGWSTARAASARVEANLARILWAREQEETTPAPAPRHGEATE